MARDHTSDLLKRVIKTNRSDRITIDEIRISLHERGYAILMLLFALPLSIPIPYIPGLTTVLSTPLIFLSGQMFFGMDSPWLPKWIAKRSIKRSTLGFIILKTSPYLKRVEKILKVRLVFMCGDLGTKIIGLFCFVFAVSIALPLPLTNLVPAIGILIICLGLLSHDGLFILLGIIVGLYGIFFTIAVIYFGKKLVVGFLNKLFAVFN